MDTMDSSMEDSENREDDWEESSIKNGEMERISEGIPSSLPSTKTVKTEEKRPDREKIPYGNGNNW
jgi:hypothetical protein